MTFLEQITPRGPVCDAGFGGHQGPGAHPHPVRHLTLIGICVIAPFIGPAACHVERAEARESRTASKVIVRPVVPVSRRATVAASGIVMPGASVDLSFQVAGMVMAVGGDEGEQVAAGELVAALDPTEYALAFEQAKLEYVGATSQAQRIRASGMAAGAPPGDYNDVMAAVALTKLAAARAEKRLYETQLVSPLAGVVARRAVKPGEIVSSGTPAFTIVNLDVIRVRVSVSESQIARISRGADAMIAVPALDTTWHRGKVRMVGVAANPETRAFTVEVEVPNREHRLKPGMSANVSISTTDSTTAVSVPRVALHQDEKGGPQVFVYSPAERRVHARRVALGTKRAGDVDVTSGLEAGEMIVVGSRERLADGVVVQPMNEPIVVTAVN